MDWGPKIYTSGHILTTAAVVLLSLILQASSCPVPKFPGVICSCDKRLGHDYIGGWQIHCTKDDGEQSAFFMDYAIGNYIEVQCDTVSPFKPRMFDGLNVSEVQNFNFLYCDMPNISFGEVLAGMNVKGLELRDCKTGEELKSELFEGLDSLSKLEISSTKALKRLPENFFDNMTSLAAIYLNDNAISELPEKIFHPITNVTFLNLGGNQLTNLSSNQFRGLSKLNLLLLYKNNLTSFPSDLFNETTALTSLDILGNKFTKLPMDSLSQLSQLTYLRLSNNPIKQLEDMMFKNNKQLVELNLSGLNKLIELPEKLLAGLSKLENISLSDCNLTSIPEKFFGSAPNLKNVQMKNNRLKSLPPNLFRENLKLRSLDMSYNDLVELHTDIFLKQFALESLELYKNNLVLVPRGVFDKLSSLDYLGLSSNMIEKIEDDAFQNLQSVKTINLNNNKITTLPSYTPFGTNKILQSVDLSHNNITELSSTINWALYLSLGKLNLDYNKITRFVVPVMFCDNTEMSLRFNQIKTVLVDEVKSNAQLQGTVTANNNDMSHSFYLEGNPFTCDCDLLDFATYIRTENDEQAANFKDYSDYICRGPEKLKDKLVVSVDYGSFLCTVTENCPTGCTCFYKKYDKTKHVLCNNLNLTSLPDVAPTNTNILSLKNNSITSLNGLDSTLWTNLTELYLDNNYIKSLDNVSLPKHLQVLSLENNQISRLSSPVKDFVSKASGNFKLYLSSNPWTCDCSTTDFKSWLTQHIFQVPDYKSITCSKSFSYNETTETNRISDIITYCPPAVAGDNRKQLILVSTLCAVLAVLLVLVSVLYYKNKQTVTAYIYIHFHSVFVCFFDAEDLDEEKMFDAFVSYSSNDRDVAMSLLNNLENSEDKFKLCIHERDWLPGYNISWNIVNSVQNSRRTILVVSKDFLESMWFQVEFHTAYYQMLEDRVDRLIVIVKGELPPKDSLDKELKFLLSTKTYLVWGERWFWEKLRYGMPHYKQVKGPDKFPLRNRPNGHMIKTVEEQIANLTNNPKASQKEAKSDENKNETEEVKLEILPDKRTVNGNGCIQRVAEQS